MDKIKVGVLFSKTGTSYITEREHIAGTLLAIEEINRNGGLLGRELMPISYDPGGISDKYRAMARQMLVEDEVDVLFGCSMSASRKAVLPIVERHNGLLFYPSIYEGFEYSENLVYCGATTNQVCPPLADYLIENYGKRIYFVGCDYIYPRESNRVMRDLIEAKGGEVIEERYVPVGASPEQTAELVSDILKQKPDAVFSTIISTAAHAFYNQYDAAEIDRIKCPIASLTMAETEIAHIGAHKCNGHILASTYFQTLDTACNDKFVRAYRDKYGEAATTSTYSEPAYLQVHLYARTVERLGKIDAKRVAMEVIGDEFEAPEGTICVDADTRHLWLTPRIGVAQKNGLFDIVWKGGSVIRPDPYLATTRFEEKSLEGWA